ncbi:MAG: hypothetical protein E6Q97_14215 [Desulfurellales bacterium]|nr:MAG: hypothetical protein E6Q97_14215 [Desulfurellales bacterium]
MSNVISSKRELFERMLAVCERGAAAGSLDADVGVAKYRAKLMALNAVSAMIAGVEPKPNTAASYEARLANIVNGGESYFYGDASEVTEATALMGAIFRRVIRVDGPAQNGYVRLGACDVQM